MSAYLDALKAAMERLAQDDRVLFLGQGCACPGTFMSQTLADVPMEKRIELPVAEEMQMGMTCGLALQGFVPVSIYPRFNFLILATNQLVNHVDKLPLVSAYRPRAIIRVGVGADTPLDPGPQHVGNYTEAFRSMLQTVTVVELTDAAQVADAYAAALSREGVTLMVEHASKY